MTTNRYPFATKSEIKAQIESDVAYACACLVLLRSKQTEYEVETKSTLDRNHRGFMSSHASVGCKLAEKILAGENLTVEEIGTAQNIAHHYTKQIARYERETAVEANPDLAIEASVFFKA